MPINKEYVPIDNQPTIKPRTVTGIFTRYIAKTLPLAFDESMSYYECLCALLEYINTKVIPALDNNAAGLLELQEFYEELQTYVNDYFKNLDVQEEINNKLDDMVEAGTLQEIIANYLNSKAVFGYDTVSDMKNATNLINGSYARTLGYYSKNDGGSALYKIRTITNDDVVDEMFIIAMENDNSLIAELIILNKINVKCLGVNTTNFVTILNSLLNNTDYTKYPIYIPKETYLITSPIIVSQPNTILEIDADININTDITALKINTGDNSIKINGSISSLNQSNREGTGIEIGSDTINIGFNNLYINTIYNTENGILINPNNNHGVHYNKIKFDKITADYGIRFKVGDTSTPWINENSFTGGRLSGGIGIYTEKGTNQTDPYNGNKFNEIGYEDIECGIELNFARWNIFDQCRMAENLTGDYWIYCHSDSNENTFNIQQNIRVTTLRDDNNTMNNRNIYNPNAICDADWYRIGKSCYSAGGLFAIPEGECYDNDRINIQHYNQSGAITNPALFSSDVVISVGGDNANANYDVTLPAGVFNIRKLKSFYVYVVYKEATSTINIKTSDNTTLIDTTLFGENRVSRKLYQVKYLPDRYAGYTWKLIELNVK